MKKFPKPEYTAQFKEQAVKRAQAVDIAVRDPFSREIIGGSTKPRITSDIVNDALTMAWFRRKPGSGALVHGDRGRQYASQAMAAKPNEYEMTASMSAS